MIALYIIGGILLLLILLLLVKISVFFSYYGKVPELKIKIGFISLGYNLKELKKEAEEVAEAEPQKIKKVKKKKDRTPPPSLKDSIRVFKAGIMQFWGKYKRYAKLERYVLKISVSTDDPAKTAILYGGISSVAGVLHAWAVSVRKRSKKMGDIYTEVKPDFIAEKTDAAAEIGMSLKVWQIVSCLITAYRTYRKYKKLPPKEGRKVK